MDVVGVVNVVVDSFCNDGYVIVVRVLLVGL